MAGSATQDQTNPLQATQPTADNNVTEVEFNEFCEGENDPMLKFIEEEMRQAAAANLTRSSNITQQSVSYENTYRTEPTYKFFSDKATSIISSVLNEALVEVSYDHQSSSKMACELSERIKEEIKQNMDIPRHKIVSFVVIGERRNQGVRVGSRCVWNSKFDSFASSSFENKSLFAVGIVYGVFLE